MTYFVRVVRGNVNAAVRELTRQTNVDNLRKIARENKFHEKPGAKRRRKREECKRRWDTRALYSNLNAVFSRQARGF